MNARFINLSEGINNCLNPVSISKLIVPITSGFTLRGYAAELKTAQNIPFAGVRGKYGKQIRLTAPHFCFMQICGVVSFTIMMQRQTFHKCYLCLYFI